jgi:uncharacterized alkaline shock family protein YloU
MNLFNRIVVILLLVVSIPVLTVVLVVPQNVLVNLGDQMMSFGYSVNNIQPSWLRLAGGILIALIWDALAVFLIFREIKSKRNRYISVKEVSGGMAKINPDSIRQQLEYAIDPLPGIVKVKPKVTAKRDKVRAEVEVTVHATSNVPDLATNLVKVIRQVLTTELGLQVAGDPQVRITVATPDQKQPPREEPEPEPLPETEPAPELELDLLPEPEPIPEPEPLPEPDPESTFMSEEDLFEFGEEDEEDEENYWGEPDAEDQESRM